MYRCPKCKQPLVSELDLANGIERTIGYFIDNGIRVCFLRRLERHTFVAGISVASAMFIETS